MGGTSKTLTASKSQHTKFSNCICATQMVGYDFTVKEHRKNYIRELWCLTLHIIGHAYLRNQNLTSSMGGRHGACIWPRKATSGFNMIFPAPRWNITLILVDIDIFPGGVKTEFLNPHYIYHSVDFCPLTPPYGYHSWLTVHVWNNDIWLQWHDLSVNILFYSHLKWVSSFFWSSV